MSNFLYNTVEYVHDYATGQNISDTGVTTLVEWSMKHLTLELFFLKFVERFIERCQRVLL